MENNKSLMKIDKDFFGKIFFILSILLLIYMLISPLFNNIIHVDEYWTNFLVKLPLMNGLDLTIWDVHPPLYYLILKFVLKTLTVLGIDFDVIIASKIVSIIPFILILILSFTKIKREYGWLTAGLFALCMASVSEFFVLYLTIRMYSWAILFLLLSFIVFKDILDESKLGSWILLSIFTVLGAYTHYFDLVSSGLLYLFILGIILFSKKIINKKDEIKKWIFSSILTIVLYLPWIFVLLNQIKKSQNYFTPEFPNIGEFINYLLYFGTVNRDLGLIVALSQIVALVFLIIMIYSIFIRRNEDGEDNLYIFTGYLLYFATILVGVLILILTFKPLQVRYLLPVISIFWLSSSILIGKMKNKKMLILSVTLVLILCGAGFAGSLDTENDCQAFWAEQSVWHSMNDENNILIISSVFKYACYSDYLNKTTIYSTYDFGFSYFPHYLIEKNITKIIDENPDKNVYYIVTVTDEDDLKSILGDDVKYEKIYNRGHYWYLKLEKNN